MVDEAPRHSRGRRIATTAGIVAAIGVFYACSLLTYHWLADTSHPLGPADLGTVSDTIVVMDLEALRTADHRLDVKVFVLPEDSLVDDQNVLKQTIVVRFYPEIGIGDLVFPQGKTPARVAVSFAAHGDPDRWPFDSYTTDEIGAGVFVGTGSGAEYIPARVEVTGSLEGWGLSSVHTGESTQSSPEGDDVVITLRRARGPLIFDLGICLVLVSLPAVALFVAIQMVRGKKKFVAPFSTWYAAMLFAIVPLRNILPGAPPPGGWIDQALVVWVLLALVVAMILYIIAWHRHSE